MGPKLRAKGVIPMSVEASEWLHTWSNESACCSEPSGLPSSDPLECGGFNGDPIAEHCTTDFGGYDYGHALAADPDAWAAFDILGTHHYDTQVAYPWPDDVPPRGDKEVWQTEMSGVKWWPEQGPSNTIENGVAIARWVHSALVVGEANAWLWWWYSGTAPSAMVPLLTAASKNWAEGTPVTVTDATLPMALEAMSVTTFVSQ
ncbi:hypothetical protein WME76_38785 [Sorangium sp. So ce119]|uniref:hypothetical protein n=1 Tax=Sorangium sp. So ce119 TaxID=3133279 RepID=UPI003F603F76